MGKGKDMWHTRVTHTTAIEIRHCHCDDGHSKVKRQDLAQPQPQSQHQSQSQSQPQSQPQSQTLMQKQIEGINWIRPQTRTNLKQ
ncbi:uncharacterized protein DDB_G0292186 [Drosophila persimilis]|uniref:uncharacterized protein DDB_G0292186 n=1 Tax=Drosophila persimilis TaxID=7234 RepID=UPI000F0989EC|nr:uncharacterized protein DDB_G0292186 [Drosophila persimilis]